MIMRFFVFSLTWLFLTVSAMQRPTGFITLKECAQKGAAVTYLLEEPSGARQFILTLKNGFVVGEGGIVTGDGKIFADTETYKQDQQGLLKKSSDNSKEDLRIFDGTLAVISCPGQQCYYHWLLQTIPRLKLLSAANQSYDKIYVYADNFKYHWQKDALYTVMDHLAISRDKPLFAERDTIVQAKKLLVPSVPWVPSKPEFWESELEWYKKFFKDTFVNTTEQTPPYIFISRSKAQYRRISNETALMKLLNAKGFVSYCLEDLSIREQATLFNNAKVIVGPHGAGWTNLIFCKPGTKIIEIDHGLKGDEQRSPFKGMAKRMGCFYYPFYIDLLEPTDSPENIHAPINQDMIVDIDVFREFLQKIAYKPLPFDKYESKGSSIRRPSFDEPTSHVRELHKEIDKSSRPSTLHKTLKYGALLMCAAGVVVGALKNYTFLYKS